MLLYLIRHGETPWNRAHRFQGWQDLPLTETGLEQARQLARRMAGVTGVCRLWSSPLQRAFTTAQLVGEAMGLTPEPLDGLREINMGRWAGHPVPELLKGPEAAAVRRWLAGDPELTVPDGESLRTVQARAVAALRPLLSNVPGDAAVVAHGLSLKALTFGLLDLPLSYDRLFDLDNASVSVLRWEPDRPAKLLLLNDTAHLDCPADNGAFWESDLS